MLARGGGGSGAVMDSGNSGSLQSSSGGDDEFDSRGAGAAVDSSPLSALLRQPPPSPSAAAFSLHGAYFGGLQDFTSSAPPPPQQQQQPGSSWSPASFAGASGLPSSSSSHPDAGAGARQQQPADAAAVAGAAPQAGQGAAASAPAPRGSRKRTRASRRAPTTVLTTDTSNFRAMVQEFTGIPSPPFGAGAAGIGVGGPGASLRTRFDHIFPPTSSLRAAAGGADSLPPYLLRPFAHKLPTASSSAFPPFTTTTTSSSTSSTPSSSNIGVANANAAAGTAAAGPSNSNPAAPIAAAADTFQQLTSSALLRLQDPASSYLSFQNLLNSQQPSSQSIFGAAGGFAAQASRPHDPAPSPSDYLASAGSGGLGLAHGGLLGGSDGLQLHHSRSDVHGHGSDELSGVVAAGASGGSCKLNYSQSHPGGGNGGASSPGAGGGAEKPPDGGGGGAPGRQRRGEGLDPWICTSE
ncbi:hypothetical protein U9M48_014245 [Paspalum notatum var. saurae]|uniref:VQ domain-containing protein n=1 Tax=Paspalum notatum var. saurae TaxID=547442 RepID=A0AAQ3T1L7_PASNO